MADKHVRMVIEFDIDEESLQEKGLKAEDVFKHIVLKDNDVIDGFEIFTAHPDFDCASDFFLCAGSVVSKEFIQERSLGDGLDKWREMIRDELMINNLLYNLSDAEAVLLCASHELIDALAFSMEDWYMSNPKYTEYDVLEEVFSNEFPAIFSKFRETNPENKHKEDFASLIKKTSEKNQHSCAIRNKQHNNTVLGAAPKEPNSQR